jgi:hypothetical protein
MAVIRIARKILDPGMKLNGSTFGFRYNQPQCCIKKMAKGWQTHMGVEATPH